MQKQRGTILAGRLAPLIHALADSTLLPSGYVRAGAKAPAPNLRRLSLESLFPALRGTRRKPHKGAMRYGHLPAWARIPY